MTPLLGLALLAYTLMVALRIATAALAQAGYIIALVTSALGYGLLLVGSGLLAAEFVSNWAVAEFASASQAAFVSAVLALVAGAVGALLLPNLAIDVHSALQERLNHQGNVTLALTGVQVLTLIVLAIILEVNW